MDYTFEALPGAKKIYLASDFHLGAPSQKESREREDKIVRWLNHIQKDAAGIILVGDLFDFWFEYKHVIPKGSIRFQGKLAELKSIGIPILIFTGNHDLWMFDYFEEELDIPILRNPQSFQIGPYKIHIGHGDGLGPGDKKFKFFKSVFTNRWAQKAFRWLHPDVGIWLAKAWSNRSKKRCDETFKGDDERLLQYCKGIEAVDHHDYYVFGHRHMPLSMEVSDHSRYFNLGEWISDYTYLSISASEVKLEKFEE